MKKRICVMALTLALAAGGLSLASDLKLADGHILPLGNEMTLREADKSYVGKELQKEWNQEKAEKEILPAVKRMGLFGKGDTVHEKMMALMISFQPADFPSCKWRRRMLFIRRLLYL